MSNRQVSDNARRGCSAHLIFFISTNKLDIYMFHSTFSTAVFSTAVLALSATSVSAQRPSTRDIQQHGLDQIEDARVIRVNEATDTSPGYKVFTSPIYPLTFQFPEGWDVHQDVNTQSKAGHVTISKTAYGTLFIETLWDRSFHVLYSELGIEDDGTRALDIKYTQESGDFALAEKHPERLRFREFSLIHKEEFSFEGHKALRVQYDAIYKSENVRVEVVFIAHPELTYTVRYVTTPEQHENFDAHFEKIIDSLKIPAQKKESVTTQQINHDAVSTFKDVPGNAWYASFVSRAKSSGVASGYKDTAGNPLHEFRPANSVTVAEFLKMSLEAKGLSADRYKNTAEQYIDHWSNVYVHIAVQKNFGFRNINVEGFQDLIKHHSDRPITRGEAAGMLAPIYKILGGDVPFRGDAKYAKYAEHRTFLDTVSHIHKSSIHGLTNAGVITGDTDAQGNLTGYFRPDESLNRAEALKLIFSAKDF